MLKKLAVALSLSIVIAGISVPTAGAAEAVEEKVISRAEDGLEIDITIYQPDDASPENQVPVVLFSHGWGGTKDDGSGLADDYNNAGFGYVTISQRGHGETGGQRNVQDPQLEAQDIMAVIDRVAELDWVQHNTTVDPVTGEVVEDPTDPVLGAIGGSYGGGYQTMTALTEIDETGTTRFDALAPEITWYDLPTSLAPEGVARTSWVTALYATAKATGTIPEFIDQAFAWGATTGQWPGREEPYAAAEEAAGIPNMTDIFRSHSPRGFVEQGVKLDIPVLQRQGATDNLFNLNEGLNIFEKALTDDARAKSIFTSYNGGHVLPAVGSTLPLGSAPSDDPCNDEYPGEWNQMRLDFFAVAFAGENPRTALNQSAYNLATDDNGCRRLDSLPATVERDVDPTGFGYWGAPTGAFVPQSHMLAEGPGYVAGTPRIKGDLYNFGQDTRAFFALSVGTVAADCADAKVVQNNMMPLRESMPQMSIEGTPFNEEIPAVAVDLAAGEALCLTISPVSDTSFGHGSRSPGLMGFDGLEVVVPWVQG